MLHSITQRGPAAAVPAEGMAKPGSDPRAAVARSGETFILPDTALLPESGAPDESGGDEPVDALPAESGVDELQPPMADILPADPTVTPETESRAERWLLSMLDQRATRVQAQDSDETPARQTMDIALRSIPQVLVNPLRQDGRAQPLSVPSSLSISGALAMPETPVAMVLHAAQPGEGSETTLLAPLERAGNASSLPQAASTVIDGTNPIASPMAAVQPATALERTLKLEAPEAKWGEQMLHALRDTVELQVQQRVQNASIRLDPPELGSLEIYLSHESGRLNVQISAAQSDVARLLNQTSERLRQELVGQNFLQVSVQVSADGQSGQQHARQGRAWTPVEDEIAANALRESTSSGSRRAAPDDVLVTV
ncbi:hypothetical protein BZL41_17835 [Pseudomonas sp. PIC25]|uniref:flagellar hook-length control protein FliK n=1 Tax=Pseudomonas sp. PIC25 TaxID=1958773 RepID=UPI000BABF6AD|nr:flagellar hook-length control protein FliK [Pseudomonas sp. PIC25]PAU58381.1 hypothetical protein BZL41_17835 [Pseudomonas sp. PIC25]